MPVDMSDPAEPPPPPPPPSHEHETLIQYNLRNKVCVYCKRPGALLKCEACRQRSYCDRKCQKKDWKQEHRGQCVKLQQVFFPPPPGWRGAAAEAGCRAAAAADIGDDELENPCPICLDNEDDATVDGNDAGMCSACGHFYCGACKAAEGFAIRSPSFLGNCPTCRAPMMVSDEQEFKRLWKLVHDRSPGRYTPTAQYNLGVKYRLGKGVKQNDTEAVKWFRKSAEAGFASAQFNLGVAYETGRGVKQDNSEGVKWHRRASEQGVAVAQYNLGVSYDVGVGVEQDYKEAVKLYKKAAEAGSADAQFNLGIMYDNGRGVDQNDAKAVKWWRCAALQGYANAQYNLGNMYSHGKGGVKQDYNEAIKLWRCAAEQGNSRAQLNIGVMYTKGKGVPQDFAEALK